MIAVAFGPVNDGASAGDPVTRGSDSTSLQSVADGLERCGAAVPGPYE